METSDQNIVDSVGGTENMSENITFAQGGPLNADETAVKPALISASNEVEAVSASSRKHSKGEALIICGDVGTNPTTDSGASLQDSFKKFLTQKKREKQIQKMCRDNALDGTSQKRSEAYKESLRHKFIEQAKHYMGVPYAERYKDPDAAVAPLYLDCCGLIRQVVKDLQEDFGFIIGRWNQCYQMDTLPLAIEEHELKPGDLIFYEGEFNSPRHKRQKHNNVHVEIFLGGETGESTIGARFQRGVVSIFPSYKFKSTTWDLVRFHYRSIDTWLDGICKSCCPEHTWESDLLAIEAAAGKRSIFSDEFEENRSRGGGRRGREQEEDVNAGDEDDQEEDGQGGGQEGNGEGDEGTGKGESESSAAASAPAPAPAPAPAATATNNEAAATATAAPASGASEADPLVEASPVVADAEVPGAVATNASNPQQATAAVTAAKSEKEKEKPAVVTGGRRATTTTATTTASSASSKPAGTNKSTSGAASAAMSARSRSFDETTSPTRQTQAQSLKLPKQAESPQAGIAGGSGTGRRQRSSNKTQTGVSTSLLASSTESLEESNGSLQVAAGDLASLTLSPPKQAAGGAGVSQKKSGTSTRARAMSSSMDSLSNSAGAGAGGACTYYVAKANGWPLVKAALDKRGWQQLPFDYNFSSRFGLKWVERRSQIDYKQHQPGQLVCHIPNNEIICSKVGLLQTMREHFCKSYGSVASSSSPAPNRAKNPPWLPETYLLHLPEDVEAAIAVEEGLVASRGSGCMWIYKPPCNNRGRGIQVFRGVDTMREICFGVDTGNPDTTIPSRRGLIQRYMENPLLVGADGFKFDIRCYMLIARNAPTVMAFYHPGYCRLTLKPYSAAADLIDDPTIHLTNAAIQKKDPLYKENKESQIRTVEMVAAEIEQTGNTRAANYMRTQLDHDIKCCMVDVLKASVPKLLRKHGYFDLLGFDFMINDENKLVLLEINTNPAMSLDNSTLEALLPNVIDGTIQLVLDLQGPVRPPPNNSSSVSVTRDNNVLADLPYQFQLIMNEHTGYMYGAK